MYPVFQYQAFYDLLQEPVEDTVEPLFPAREYLTVHPVHRNYLK